MEFRTLEINVISAKDIKNVNFFSKMDVYVVVSISGDPYSKHKTPVDRDGGTSPSWNFPIKFTIDNSAAEQNRLSLVFQIKSSRSLGDRHVGEVIVPVKELLDSRGDGASMQFVSYQVRKPSGKPRGTLNLSFKFGGKFVGAAMAPPPPMPHKADEPVKAYPAAMGSGAGYPQYAQASANPYPPPSVSGYGYPPPPPAYGGGYAPPPPGYGYPPPQPGYGYPPMQQPPKKNKFGMGLGAGLLGGALGGLLIGDMVSDAAYDGACDSGFGDMDF